jgi:hypothetical protein
MSGLNRLIPAGFAGLAQGARFWLGAALLATEATAATHRWTQPDRGSWSDASAWDSPPAPDGSAEVVLTHLTAGKQTVVLDTDATVRSLSYDGGQGKDVLVLDGADRTLRIGAGGIRGCPFPNWMKLVPKIVFTEPEVSLASGNIYFCNQIESTAPGGTRIRLKGADWRFFQFIETDGRSGRSGLNLTWWLEGGHIAIYNEDPNQALGLNKVLVTGDRSGQRIIGVYGNTTLDEVFWDVPIEIDEAVISCRLTLALIFDRHSRDADPTVTHVRGPWTTRGGAAPDNLSGLGFIALNGRSNDPKASVRYEADNRALLFRPAPDDGYNGDIQILSGIHVLASPHAFGLDNGMTVNLADQSGGTTKARSRSLLTASGIRMTGRIRIYGGSSLDDNGRRTRAEAIVGLDGPGETEFSGKILLNGWDAHEQFGDRGFNACLYATNGGTVVFSGAFEEVHISGKLTAPEVAVTGGGVVAMTAESTYTNRTSVTGGSTLRLDGSLASLLLDIGSGSTLSGSGRTAGRLSSSGTVAPGASGLTVGSDAIFLPGSALRVELPTDGGDAEPLTVGGELDLSNATLVLSGGRANATYTIASAGRRIGSAVARVDASQLSPGLTAGPAQVQADGNRLRVTLLKGSSTAPAAGGSEPLAIPGTARWVNGLSAGEAIAAEAGGLRVRTPQGAETLIPWPALSPGTRYRHEPGFPDRLRPAGAPADPESLWPVTPRT